MPRFGPDGLLTAVVSDAESGQVLMVAHMNEEAIKRTLATGEAHFFSRSRQQLWHKGATSGNVLVVKDLRTDCDQDALWLTVTVKGHGAACHTGKVSCFYRLIVEEDGKNALKMDGSEAKFDPTKIYHK